MAFSRWVWISSTLFWDGGDFKTAGDRKKRPRPVTLPGSGARQQIDFAAKASERHAKPPRRVLESQIAAPVKYFRRPVWALRKKTCAAMRCAGQFCAWPLRGRRHCFHGAHALVDLSNNAAFETQREVNVTLRGKKGLVIGIANDQSVAYGCAAAFVRAGASLAITYLNVKAEPYVRPLAEDLKCPIIVPCDVREPGQLEAVFAHIRDSWGRLDFVLHSIAFAPKEDLHSRVVDCSQAGFALAMDVSCHSFIRVARLAEPLMPDGGCLLTVSFQGAGRVVENYNLMGPVKAALESSVRYMAAELGPKRIRVHALSPGPLKTRAASGIVHFDELLERTRARTPERMLASIEDVGNLAVFLASDAAAAITGNIEYIDAGFHILG